MGLNAEETHLWFTDLDQQVQDETVDFLLTLLDAQERARALRFRRAELTNRFVTAHGRLRQVLGYYLGQAPDTVQFCYGDRGKPALETILNPSLSPCLEMGSETGTRMDSGLPPLQFNLSHSDRYALIAISHYPVGVDLEVVKPFPSASSLAKRFFSAKEFEALQLLNDLEPQIQPTSQMLNAQKDADPNNAGQNSVNPITVPDESSLARSIGFLRHWVCKEAYVKATGRGLVDQLNQVVLGFQPQAHFTTLPGTPASGSSASLLSSNPLPWQVMEFTPSASTLAALVLPQDAPLRCQYWQL